MSTYIDIDRSTRRHLANVMAKVATSKQWPQVVARCCCNTYEYDISTDSLSRFGEDLIISQDSHGSQNQASERTVNVPEIFRE